VRGRGGWALAAAGAVAAVAVRLGREIGE
jgi:hypothetical protein